MSRYHIDWSGLIGRDLVQELATVAGVDTPLGIEDVRPLLTRILAATGGWPYTDALPSSRQTHDHIRRLLGEAFAHVLGGGAAAPGYRLQATPDDTHAIEAVPRMEINIAGRDELALLPELTPSRARAIVAERERGGPFRGIDDLHARLPRLGKQRAAALARVVSFRVDPPAAGATGDWRRDLAALIAQEPAGGARDRLLAALERVARIVAADRHPHLRHRLPRSFKAPARPRSHTAAEATVLAGRRYYYYVRDALRAAERSIDVMMFHIAMPRHEHPTRQLLDALVQAHRRGVRVRVLVDRDRRDDPYRSQVINAAAVQYLLANGIAVRVDRPDRLLHSKLIVVDGSQTIAGSHNWSAGSFFMFDDLSVAVHSAEVAQEARKRFDTLWRRGERAKSGRGTARRG